MATIPITGIPSSFLVPGTYVEILSAQGPSTSSGGVREVVFVMPKDETDGTWTAATLYEIANEQDVIDGAGAGSPLHRAVRAALAVNKNAKYWAVPYLPSSGGGGAVAADVDLTYATNPTATGTAEVWVCGELAASYAYTSSDTVTTVAAALVAEINAKLHLPVTAGNVAGVLTVTAKIIGASQGDGTVGQYQVYSKVSSGTGVTVNAGTEASVEVGDTVNGSDGTTTENTNFVAALAALDAVRKYYIGVSVSDTTNLASLQTHISTKSDPNPGLRSVGIAAYTHTKAGATTIANARNYERIRFHAGVNLEADWATIVGHVCGLYQKKEELDSAAGFDLTRTPGIAPARQTSDWLTVTDMNDMITEGITPIASDANGTYIVMATTTRSKDSSGSTDDTRALEPHRISVADHYADIFLDNDRKTYVNSKLQADELLPDGTVNTNQDLAPNVTTPHFYKVNFVNQQIVDFAPGRLQELAATLDSVRVVQDPNNKGRLEVGHDLHVIDIRHQATIRLAEVSPG